MSDIPAGWQPDPRGRHEYRYWDGTQWTDHVSDQGEVSQDPVADATPAGAAEPAATEPTVVQETAAPAAAEPEPVVPEPEPEPEPVAAEPEPVVAEPEPEPVVVEPEPVAAEPAPVVSEPAPVVSDPGPGVAEPVPAAAAAPVTPAASSAPPGATASTAQTEAKAAAQDMLHSKSIDLATVLSVIAPGSGHFYMGAANAVPVGAGLLGATLVAVILAYIGFITFIIGLIIWAGAAFYAVKDLRGDVAGIENTSLPPSVVGILLIGAGVVLVVSIFLPFYHVKIDAGDFGGGSGNISGWDSLEIIRFVLLLVGLASIAAGAASLNLGPVTSAELPRQLPLAVAVGGAIAAVLILFRMLVDVVPNGDGITVGRAPGILLAMDAALVLVVANLGVLRSAANR